MNNNSSSRYEKDFINTNSNFEKKPNSKRALNYQSNKNSSNQSNRYYNSNTNKKKEEEEIAKPMFINSKLSINQEEHFIALEKTCQTEEVPKLNLISSTELEKELEQKKELAPLDSQFEKKYNSSSANSNYYLGYPYNTHSSSSFNQKYNRGNKGSHNIYQPEHEHGYHQSNKNYNRNRNVIAYYLC